MHTEIKCTKPVKVTNEDVESLPREWEPHWLPKKEPKESEKWKDREQESCIKTIDERLYKVEGGRSPKDYRQNGILKDFGWRKSGYTDYKFLHYKLSERRKEELVITKALRTPPKSMTMNCKRNWNFQILCNRLRRVDIPDSRTNFSMR